MMKKDFEASNVVVTREREKEGKWEFGGKSVKGTIIEFTVIDHNFGSDNKWSFIVREPDRIEKGAYVEVKPVDHPQKTCWDRIERMSINFSPADMPNYNGMMYAQIFIADVDGRKTKRKNRIVVKNGQRPLLPHFFRYFKIRRKETVATSRVNDGRHLVIVTHERDYDDMIKVFLATKAWVLYNRFVLDVSAIEGD